MALEPKVPPTRSVATLGNCCPYSDFSFFAAWCYTVCSYPSQKLKTARLPTRQIQGKQTPAPFSALNSFHTQKRRDTSQWNPIKQIPWQSMYLSCLLYINERLHHLLKLLSSFSPGALKMSDAPESTMQGECLAGFYDFNYDWFVILLLNNIFVFCEMYNFFSPWTNIFT